MCVYICVCVSVCIYLYGGIFTIYICIFKQKSKYSIAYLQVNITYATLRHIISYIIYNNISF